LDRAVTLCVKYFVPFALIQLAFSIPFGVVRYYATQNFATMMQTFTSAMQSQGAGKPVDPYAMSVMLSRGGVADAGWTFAFVLGSFLFLPLVVGALIDATSAAYLGTIPTFAESYRVGLSRWLNIIGINVLYAVSGGGLYVIAFIATLLVVFAVAAIVAAAHWVGVALGVALGIVGLVVTLALIILVTMALQISYFACVVERANFAVAFIAGLRRIARGAGLKRALLVGFAYYLVLVAIGVVSFAGQLLFSGLLRSPIAGTAFVTLVSVATAAFTTAFMTIFYFDLRVREEGLDLQLAAEATLGRPLAIS